MVKSKYFFFFAYILFILCRKDFPKGGNNSRIDLPLPLFRFRSTPLLLTSVKSQITHIPRQIGKEIICTDKLFHLYLQTIIQYKSILYNCNTCLGRLQDSSEGGGGGPGGWFIEGRIESIGA